MRKSPSPVVFLSPGPTETEGKRQCARPRLLARLQNELANKFDYNRARGITGGGGGQVVKTRARKSSGNTTPWYRRDSISLFSRADNIESCNSR